MKKSELLELVQTLPDEVELDLDNLIYTLHFRREVDRGLADADAGREISHEEFERESESWLE